MKKQFCLCLMAAFLGVSISTGAHAQSNFDRGLEAYGDGLYREAARLWEMSAGTGDARARFNLAVLLEHGKGVPQDIDAAVAWYRQAAKDGFLDAQYSLANLLMVGTGSVSKNTDEAIMWYVQAADDGHIPSQFKVGSMMVDGKEVPQDLASAERWLQLASTNGHMEAESLLNRIRAERDRHIQTASWVKQADPNAYTVELFKSPDAERARKFVRVVGLESAAVFESADGIHHVVAGVFADSTAANSAVQALPEPLRLRIPVVRQFQQLQLSMAQ